MHPGDCPTAVLAQAIGDQIDPQTFHILAPQIARLLVIIDQFEELIAQIFAGSIMMLVRI